MSYVSSDGKTSATSEAGRQILPQDCVFPAVVIPVL